MEETYLEVMVQNFEKKILLLVSMWFNKRTTIYLVTFEISKKQDY